MTELTFDGPTGIRTFVLREEDGAAKVDDVLSPAANRPESLKRTCELVLPARRYGRALAAGDLPALRRSSSDAFNRLVWHQLRGVPTAAIVAAGSLADPLASAGELDRGEGARSELTFASAANVGETAVLKLVRERGRLVVDDVELRSGPAAGDAIALKQALREHMAYGNLRLSTAEPPPMARTAAKAVALVDPAVRPVAAELPSAAAPSRVQTAAHETPAPPSPPRPPEAADAPAPFAPPPGTTAIVPAAPPVCGCDGGTCAPFGEPLELGGK